MATNPTTPSHRRAADWSGLGRLLSGGIFVTARFSSTDRDVSMCRAAALPRSSLPSAQLRTGAGTHNHRWVLSNRMALQLLQTQSPVVMGPGSRPGRRAGYPPLELNNMIADIYSMDRMASSRERLSNFFRGVGLRQIRLASGVVLFAYLVSHFLNHALGNIPLQALAAGVRIHMGSSQSLPATI